MNALSCRLAIAGTMLFILTLSCRVARAQDGGLDIGPLDNAPGQRADNPDQRRQRRIVRQWADRMAQGWQPDALDAVRNAVGADAVAQAKRWLDRNGDSRLISSEDINPVDQAHIKMAEIHLGRKAYQDCLDRLQRIIDEAKGKENDAVWLAHLNRANVLRRHVGNLLEAVREYTLARGRWAAVALPLLLDCYDEIGRLDETVDLLAKDYGLDDPGLKLGLIRVVAEIHEGRRETDEAFKCYERITKEFSREQVETFIADAATFGETQRTRLVELANRGQRIEAEKIREETAARVVVLRVQGRVEEADAMEQAMNPADAANPVESAAGIIRSLAAPADVNPRPGR